MRLFEPPAQRLFHATAVLVVNALLFSSWPTGNVAAADEPVLALDYGRTLECRDVTPPDFSEAYPDERIVEFTLRLSVNLVSGAIDDVDAIRVEISDCDQRLRVFSFSPGTRLESEFAGDIETTKTTESSHSFNASLGGELPAPISGVVAHVTPTIGVGLGGKEVVTETHRRIAPKQAVVAAGTINEEHGVFFTLRPSPTSSLEGVHELAVQFVVPSHWRGDAVRVACQATGQQKVLWMKQQKVWSQKSTAVALYLAGDLAARRAAQRHVRQ
jgi:hypothetical protein